MHFAAACRRSAIGVAVALAAICAAPPAFAQAMQTIDPSASANGDLAAAPPAAPAAPDVPSQGMPAVTSPVPSVAAGQTVVPPPVTAAQGETYKQDDLIGAAEGVFGKGAEGLARLIQDVLKKQGEPNAYIVGREAGGAFIVGARYGSGTLFHKVEGQRPVYWTGPSVGFDVGANAGSTFVLVYNLFNTDDLYERFPAGEGQLYVVGGFNVSYVRRGNVVLIPIRVGAGLRVGVNAGYLKFTRKHEWLPF
ncbi:MAG: DUF1134 domain-containing protein [Croceibacterium sp.]